MPHAERKSNYNNNHSTTYQGINHKAKQRHKLKHKGKIWLWHRNVQQQQPNGNSNYQKTSIAKLFALAHGENIGLFFSFQRNL
jgi:hypothetical protein